MTPFDTAAAITQANKWTEAGAHMAKAMLALDRVRGDLRSARYAVIANAGRSPYVEMSYALNSSDSAIEEAFDEVANQIENLRRVIVESVLPNCPASNDETGWSAHEAICDEIEASVISIGALIKKMEMEA